MRNRGRGVAASKLKGQEIFLPTKGFKDAGEMYTQDVENVQGEIALCFLSSIVAGRVSEDEYEDVAYYTLLAIDNVISLMDYAFPCLEHSAKNRRSVGVGITNLAHDLASKGLSYQTLEGKNYMHQLAEMHSYYLHKASLRLAKEKGVAGWIDKTKYPEGWLHIDTYNRNVDLVHTQPLHFDWENLRKEIVDLGGIRNSVLEATPPAESSSLVSDTTNSLYPIREDYVIKKSGTTKVVFSAPDIDKLSGKYEYAYDIPTKHMIDCYAIFQKFHGQGISADLWKDYSRYPNEKIPMSELLTDMYYSTKMGLKSWYYQNSKSGIKEDGTSIVEDDVEGCSDCKM